MKATSRALDRRAVLRGIAAGGALGTVPLPRLGGMLNGNGTAYADGALFPKHFGIWFFGDGVIPSRFVPQATGQGSAWQLSEQLGPMANVKSHLSVVSGMNIPGVGGHYGGTCGILTGVFDPDKNGANGGVPAASLDQVIVKTGSGFDQTPFPSIQVGCDVSTGNFGEMLDYISTTGVNAGLVPQGDPRKVFDRLFGNASAQPAAGATGAFAVRKSVLDLVLADAARLRTRLGAEDRKRIDTHLDGIRTLEKRIDTLSKGLGACGIPAGEAARYAMTAPAGVNGKDKSGYYPLGEVPDDVHEVMSELIAYALVCDRTRVFSYMFTPPAAHVYYRQLGFTQSFHEITHDDNEGEKTNMGVGLVMRALAKSLEIFKAARDPAGNSLLDSSCIFISTDVASGYSHSCNDHPLLIAGKANGALRGDLHIRMNGDSTSKLLLTMANVMGSRITEFGEGDFKASTGLSQILA